MAERRMFSKTVIDSDAFLDMPQSTQCLYFHLGMRADDDGFVNSPKKIQRIIGASDDDLRLLAAKRFIIPFESGVVVIRHWKIHNYIQKDRYKETLYKNEKATISLDSSGAYQIVSTMYPDCIQNGTKVETQDRLGKVSIGEDSSETGEESIEIGELRRGEDNEDDSGSSSPSPSALKVISYFVKHGGKELSQSAVAELEGYISDMGAEVCLKAVDAAIDAGMVGWGYVRGVLIKKQSQGVQSVEDWDRVEAERDAGKAIRDSRKEGRFSWAELAVQMDEEEQLVTLDDVPKFRARSALEDYA